MFGVNGDFTNIRCQNCVFNFAWKNTSLSNRVANLCHNDVIWTNCTAFYRFIFFLRDKTNIIKIESVWLDIVHSNNSNPRIGIFFGFQVRAKRTINNPEFCF